MISRIRSHWLEVLILLAALALGLSFRLQALDIPLDRDEGIYGYIGANLGSGLVLYRDVFDHKPPVIFFVYAVVDALGADNRLNTRIAGAVFMALTTLLVYGLGRRVYGPAVGLAAAFLYTLLGHSGRIHGPHLNTEHVMLPLLLLSMLAAVEAGRRRVGWLSVLAGVTASLAILTKPVALPAVLPIFAAATISDFRGWRPACASAAWFIGGALAPVAAFGLWFLVNDALDDLYRDVFTFNTSYVGSSYTDQWEHLLAFGPIVGPLTFIALSGAFVRPSGARGFLKGSPPVLGLGSRHRVGNQARVTLPSGALFHPGNAGGRHPGVSGVSSGLARSSEMSAPTRWAATLAAAVTILATVWWQLHENLDFYFGKSVEQKIAFEFAEQGPARFWRLRK